MRLRLKQMSLPPQPRLMWFKCLFLLAYAIVVAATHDASARALGMWNAALAYVVAGTLLVFVELCFFKELKEISGALTLVACIVTLGLYAANIWLLLEDTVNQCPPALVAFAWIQFFLSSIMLNDWMPAAAL